MIFNIGEIGHVRTILRGLVIKAGVLMTVLPGMTVAGLEEGLAAYEKKDYVTAMRELRPIA